MFVFGETFLSGFETISPGFAVPEALTTSLVLPDDGGLKGAGPEEVPTRSQGFAGGVLPGGREAMEIERENYTKNLRAPSFFSFGTPYLSLISRRNPEETPTSPSI